MALATTPGSAATGTGSSSNPRRRTWSRATPTASPTCSCSIACRGRSPGSAWRRGGPRSIAPSLSPDVSDDGNIIAFVSASTQLSTDPDTVTCQSAPPACLRPFVVDRQAGTTRRVPAPAIVTSRVVDTPGGPLTITYRVEASQVFVAPDGASIAVNASSIASEITNSTGHSTESWIYHRTLGRVMQHDSGEPFASWDGRRSSYNRFVLGSVISGTIGVTRCRHRRRRSDRHGFRGRARLRRQPERGRPLRPVPDDGGDRRRHRPFRRPLRPRSRCRRRRHGDHVGDAVRAESDPRATRGRSRRRRHQQSRGVRTRQPPERRPQRATSPKAPATASSRPRSASPTRAPLRRRW